MSIELVTITTWLTMLIVRVWCHDDALDGGHECVRDWHPDDNKDNTILANSNPFVSRYWRCVNSDLDLTWRGSYLEFLQKPLVAINKDSAYFRHMSISERQAAVTRACETLDGETHAVNMNDGYGHIINEHITADLLDVSARLRHLCPILGYSGPFSEYCVDSQSACAIPQKEECQLSPVIKYACDEIFASIETRNAFVKWRRTTYNPAQFKLNEFCIYNEFFVCERHANAHALPVYVSDYFVVNYNNNNAPINILAQPWSYYLDTRRQYIQVSFGHRNMIDDTTSGGAAAMANWNWNSNPRRLLSSTTHTHTNTNTNTEAGNYNLNDEYPKELVPISEHISNTFCGVFILKPNIHPHHDQDPLIPQKFITIDVLPDNIHSNTNNKLFVRFFGIHEYTPYDENAIDLTQFSYDLLAIADDDKLVVGADFVANKLYLYKYFGGGHSYIHGQGDDLSNQAPVTIVIDIPIEYRFRDSTEFGVSCKHPNLIMEAVDKDELPAILDPGFAYMFPGPTINELSQNGLVFSNHRQRFALNESVLTTFLSGTASDAYNLNAVSELTVFIPELYFSGNGHQRVSFEIEEYARPTIAFDFDEFSNTLHAGAHAHQSPTQSTNVVLDAWKSGASTARNAVAVLGYGALLKQNNNNQYRRYGVPSQANIPFADTSLFPNQLGSTPYKLQFAWNGGTQTMTLTNLENGKSEDMLFAGIHVPFQVGVRCQGDCIIKLL